MMTISRHFFLTTVIALAACSVSAQEFKIGIVNLDRIFREANSAKAAQTKLEQEFSKREKELNDISAQLKTLSEKFERVAPTLALTLNLGKREGGFPLTPNADLSDGLFDYMHAGPVSRWDLLRNFPNMIRGTLPADFDSLSLTPLS